MRNVGGGAPKKKKIKNNFLFQMVLPMQPGDYECTVFESWI